MGVTGCKPPRDAAQRAELSVDIATLKAQDMGDSDNSPMTRIEEAVERVSAFLRARIEIAWRAVAER